MEFIPGNDLAQMLQNRKGLVFPPDQVLEWADQLLDALDYLHTLEPPIIHRDIKPQNLKLTARGQIILLDFGLAKGSILPGATAAAGQSIFGYTPNYAPLEQIQAEGTNARSDLYSLAATLYHLMTGQTPPGALTRIAAVASGQPDTLVPANEVNPHVSPSVANALMWAMSLNNNQRPATAAIMRDALRSASKGEPTGKVLSQPTTPQATATQQPRPPLPTAQSSFTPSNPNMGATQPDSFPQSSPQPVQPSWPQQPQSSWPQQPPQPSWPQPQSSWPSMPHPVQHQKKSKAPLIIGVISAVLLVSALVLGAIYFYNSDSAENNAVEKADASAQTKSNSETTIAPSGNEKTTTAATSVDEVLNKYIEAIGGEDAVRAVTSRVVKATFEIPDTGVGGTSEIYAKAPNKYFTIINGPSGLSSRVGFNGSQAWSKEATGELREIEGGELEGTKRDADFYKELDFKELYTNLSIRGKEKVKGRDSVVIEATLPEGGSDLLYFDAETGLLVRTDVTRETPQGTLTNETYFEDYREVDGIRIPFTVRLSSSILNIVIRVREVRHNVQIKDSIFDPPSAY
jgi:serine/threonine protein kinase